MDNRTDRKASFVFNTVATLAQLGKEGLPVLHCICTKEGGMYKEKVEDEEVGGGR